MATVLLVTPAKLVGRFFGPVSQAKVSRGEDESREPHSAPGVGVKLPVGVGVFISFKTGSGLTMATMLKPPASCGSRW